MSVETNREHLASELRPIVRPVRGGSADYDALLSRIGSASIVLLGEASHGTHEFYRERARITRRLIEEKGFTAVAVEADWPDALRVHRYVQGRSGDSTPHDALADFRRFPAWMWRNTDVVDLVRWLRDWNDSATGAREKTGFYGLDLYSLYSSIESVLAYLDRVDREAARRARERYGCFGNFVEDSQSYGYATTFGLTEPCEREVVAQLVELRRRAAEYASLDGRIAEDEYFFAERNAQVVRNAEKYYRSMFGSDVSSWNLRDQHMVETLASLREHLARRQAPARIILWEHNSHIGDARATEIARRGEWNVGQLVRERWPGESVHVGFTNATGTVTAADDWGEPPRRRRVRRPLEGSCENLFRQLDAGAFLLDLGNGADGARELLARPMLERAIGVIYRPETERASHYFHARLPGQFDAVIHFDETRALEPLEINPEWRTEEPPETYPTGI